MDHTSSTGQQAGQSGFDAMQHPQKPHREQSPRPDTIDSRVGLKQQFPDPEDQEATRRTTVDVVALHGLRAESPKTWIAWKDGKSAASGEVNWLRDREMLPAVIPQARILTYDWNASYAEDASGPLAGAPKGISDVTL
ncbi:hypothetical protein PG999_010005 [Apiospora kogelbergensis]|uniref:Uncharacterized protein n=1 Tax=Apiospora kogelbergensis TaxID=1337665 RepID=A0AAW0QN77_9PEZI